MNKRKGKELCNRTACQTDRDVRWYNAIEDAWYCGKCASLINIGARDSGQQRFIFDVGEYGNSKIIDVVRQFGWRLVHICALSELTHSKDRFCDKLEDKLEWHSVLSNTEYFFAKLQECWIIIEQSEYGLKYLMVTGDKEIMKIINMNFLGCDKLISKQLLMVDIIENESGFELVKSHGVQKQFKNMQSLANYTYSISGTIPEPKLRKVGKPLKANIPSSNMRMSEGTLTRICDGSVRGIICSLTPNSYTKEHHNQNRSIGCGLTGHILFTDDFEHSDDSEEDGRNC
jgi:hypothetical protein